MKFDNQKRLNPLNYRRLAIKVISIPIRLI
jgi:hypothetical protein